MRAFVTYVLGLAVFLALGSSVMLSCSDPNTQSESQTGTASMRLTAVSASGAHYRLRSGIFSITGASSKTIRSEEHLTDTTIDVELKTGAYTVTLASGWFLERAKVAGTFERVEATLLSSNPQSFEIEAQKTTNVRFRFRVAGEVIELGGTLSIGIDIEELDGGAADAETADASIEGGPGADAGADAGSMLRFRSISAGGNHTCGVLTDGTVRCWGDNTAGQLGNGTTTASATPVAVPSLSGVISISAGPASPAGNTCAVLQDGTARCWGHNSLGQLGNGTTTSSAIPVTVSNLSNVASIEVAHAHACAILRDGKVRCWGYNGNGEFGDGTTHGSPVPIEIPNMSDVVSIRSAWGSGCITSSDGALRCWQDPVDGSETGSTTPVVVASVSGAVSVTGGELHACVLLADGTVRCWGRGIDDPLMGNGTDWSMPTPFTVFNLTEAVAISAGRAHTCALLRDASVRCWGSNLAEQLGSWEVKPLVPVAVTDLSNVASLDAGGEHTCAVLTDGTARCWGANRSGQLGDGTTQHSTVPVPVHLGSCGNGALEPGEQCDPPNGDLCDATCQDPRLDGGSGQVDGGSGELPRFRSISVGEWYTCGVLIDGTVRCWGSNSSGQLGNGTRNASRAPVTVRRLSGVRSLATAAVPDGEDRICAVLENGTVHCWGQPLGPPAGCLLSTPSRPRLEPTPVANLGGITSISLGYRHTCAVRADGEASCWGGNDLGQLGNGTTQDSQSPIPLDLSRVSAIHASVSHTCAQVADSALCWGANWSGQVGAGTVGEPILSPVPVRDVPGIQDDPSHYLTNVISTSVGGNHSCAVLADGTARCWGSNGWGQLGNGQTTDSSYALEVSNLRSAVSISSGMLGSCAILQDGTVRCWGSVPLGDGTRNTSTVPVPVSNLSNVASLSVGFDHTCAVLTDGTARCWGANYAYRLGDWTNTTEALVPVALRFPICGNHNIEPGEECDPPSSGACDESCRRPAPADNCGNGNLDPGEDCDDGNQVWGDTCFECSTRHYFILDRWPEPYYDATIFRADQRGHPATLLGSGGTLSGLTAIGVEPDGRVLYALQSNPCTSQYRLLSLDPVSGTLSSEVALDAAALGYVPKLLAMTRTSDGHVYVIANNSTNGSYHLLKIEPYDKTVTEVMSLPSSTPLDVTHDNSGLLYMSTEDGIIHEISPDSRTVSVFASSAPGRSVLALTFDTARNALWAAESGGGDPTFGYANVFRFDPGSGARTQYGGPLSAVNDLLIDSDGAPIIPFIPQHPGVQGRIVKMTASGTVLDVFADVIDSPIDIEMVDFGAR